jgi:hypothetical protein
MHLCVVLHLYSAGSVPHALFIVFLPLFHWDLGIGRVLKSGEPYGIFAFVLDWVGFEELEVEDWTRMGEVWRGWLDGVILADIYGPKAGEMVQSTRQVEYEIASQVCGVYTL